MEVFNSVMFVNYLKLWSVEWKVKLNLMTWGVFRLCDICELSELWSSVLYESILKFTVTPMQWKVNLFRKHAVFFTAVTIVNYLKLWSQLLREVKSDSNFETSSRVLGSCDSIPSVAFLLLKLIAAEKQDSKFQSLIFNCMF